MSVAHGFSIPRPCPLRNAAIACRATFTFQPQGTFAPSVRIHAKVIAVPARLRKVHVAFIALM
ncbi:hypothetical protein Agau_C201045 [Agrobacterium tumefaciens F2]|nr:hypothetical protein Agau_C201045 [Agrobacterium tumefaciens F2]